MSTVHYCFSIILVLLTSCALPVPVGDELGDFIPQEELLTVALVREGMSYFNQSRYVDAELKFRQALYINPSLQNLKTNLAVTLERDGNYEEAESVYRQLLADDPDSIPLGLGLVRVFYSHGNYTQARTEYLRLLDKAYDLNDQTSTPNIARSIASLAFKVGAEEEAICYSATALAARTNADELLKHLRLLMAVGRYQDSLNLVIQYSGQWSDERNPNYLHQRALASFGLGLFDDALEFERLALEVPGADPAVRSEMIMVREYALFRLGRPSLLEEEDLGSFEEFITNVREVNNALTLYWPANLVEMVYSSGSEEGSTNIFRRT